MKRAHFIGFDAHCATTEIAIGGESGPPIKVWSCPTTIPKLVEAIESVPRPRHLVMEEGPLADWISRNLRSHVDALQVCNPRRNHLIAKESDKDDPIDAGKLVVLYRGGYTKPVHHPESAEQMAFKRLVSAYQDRVGHRVSEALRIIWLLRGYGVMVKEGGFASAEDRGELVKRLPSEARASSTLKVYWRGYDSAVEQQEAMRKELIRWARKIEPIRRFIEVPGVHWVRGAIFYAYVDTPWRFKSKCALWRYLGVGLERRGSGSGPMRVGVYPFANRRLKCMILGAARSAIASGRNRFSDQYERWLDCGLSPRIARRNVARSLAATLWGMWKSGSVYDPKWVGMTVTAASAGQGAS